MSRALHTALALLLVLAPGLSCSSDESPSQPLDRPDATDARADTSEPRDAQVEDRRAADVLSEDRSAPDTGMPDGNAGDAVSDATEEDGAPTSSVALISHLEGDDLPKVSGSVARWPARVGPDAVRDVSLDYGMPAYVPAASGLNGHAGVSVTRDKFPRMTFETPLASTPSDWTFLIVSAPSSATATATTRGYFFGCTESEGFKEGTRITLPHHGNTDGTFQKSGFFDDDYEQEITPTGMTLNRGWHQFYDQKGAAASIAAGPQVSVWVLGEPSFWVKNGVLMGRGLPDKYRRYRRAPSAKAVLFGGISEDLTSTAGYFDGRLYRFKLWRGQMSEAEALVESRKAMADFGL